VLSKSAGNPTLLQVIDGHFHKHSIARKYPNHIHAHLSRKMTYHHLTGIQLNAKNSIGQTLNDFALKLNNLFILVGTTQIRDRLVENFFYS
jgi:hypothetical protein